MYSESISRIPLDDLLDADVIFIGIFTFAAVRGYQIARYLKKRSKAVIVMGGLHASLNYKEAVHYCDYVLLGEGDETILTFLRAIKQKQPLDFPGIAFLKDGRVISTGYPSPPQDIDIIPDRNLVWNYQKMAGHNTIWPQVHASRGCPHNCDYCALVRHFGHKVRTRTPEKCCRRHQAVHWSFLIKSISVRSKICGSRMIISLRTESGQYLSSMLLLKAGSVIALMYRQDMRWDLTMKCSSC